MTTKIKVTVYNNDKNKVKIIVIIMIIKIRYECCTAIINPGDDNAHQKITITIR